MCDKVTCLRSQRNDSCFNLYSSYIYTCSSIKMPATNGHVNGERLRHYIGSGSKASAAVALLRCECGVTVLHGSGALLHLQQRGASRQSSIKHVSGISHASTALRSALCARCLAPDRTRGFQTLPASFVMHHCLGQFDLKISFLSSSSALK